MASSLSGEEFLRIQEQLINLRTNNYSLEGEKQKLSSACKNHRDKISNLEDELNKVNRVISKSKKLKEVESIVNDNITLLRKLECQEDEFRLQNSTLMQELSSLVLTNERLEKELEDSTNNEKNVECRRLAEENLLLQKSFKECGEKYEQKICLLERKLKSNEAQANDSEGGNCQSPLDAENSDDRGYQVKFELIEDENKILKERLQLANETLKESEEKLGQACEKVKKKQESILQLQNEKECMYNNHRQKFEEGLKKKDLEINQLKEMTCKLQEQLNASFQSVQDSKNKSSNYVKDLEIQCQQLHSKIDELNVTNEKRENLLAEEGERLKSSAEVAWIERDNQIRSLKDSLAENEKLVQRMEILGNEKMDTLSNLSDATKLAEKRKRLLDEMAVHLQNLTDKHSIELSTKSKEFEAQLRAINTDLESEKKKSEKLEKLKEKVDMLNERVKNAESSKGWLERRLAESEETIRLEKEKREKELEEMEKKHEIVLSDFESEKQKEIKDMNVQLELIRVQETEFEETIERLKQETKDSLEDRKIREKKATIIVKDLKRQLICERRQVEKLQARIQQLLNDQSNSQSKVDEYLVANNSEKTGDNGSVGSWSLMSGGGATDNNSAVGRRSLGRASDSFVKETADGGITYDSVENEHHELISRLAQIQQEKWIVEEKLNHLEISNSAMAEDLMLKTSIIQHYCMERRQDTTSNVNEKMTVKRLVDFIKDKGDENLRDINRKLQRMLEETLTKNIHLEKNLEELSLRQNLTSN